MNTGPVKPSPVTLDRMLADGKLFNDMNIVTDIALTIIVVVAYIRALFDMDRRA